MFLHSDWTRDANQNPRRTERRTRLRVARPGDTEDCKSAGCAMSPALCWYRVAPSPFAVLSYGVGTPYTGVSGFSTRSIVRSRYSSEF